MNKRFHIIVTGESGRSFALQLSKRKLFLSLSASAVSLITVCLVCYFTAGAYFNSKRLSSKVGKLKTQLELSEKSNDRFTERIAELEKQHRNTLAFLKKEHGKLIGSQQQEYEAQLAAQNTKIAELKKQHRDTLALLKKEHGKLIGSQQQEYEAQLAEQNTKIAELKKQHRDTLALLKKEHNKLIGSQQQEYETLLADQKVTFDLETTSLQLENVRLMNTAVNDLKQRSRLIETVMDTIGVKLNKTPAAQAQENSGGPFIPDNGTPYDNLLEQVDTYLNTIRMMPLGKPVGGRISSGFGKRTDPLNSKKAVHEGVDIRGARGDRIVATASGKVIKAMKNGGYGNYVEIDHGNGYVTAYGHMQNYLVKQGERVKQGQVIGHVGSSGRSTGPHLHYEIRLNKKPIDPEKFMNVADMTLTNVADIAPTNVADIASTNVADIASTNVADIPPTLKPKQKKK